MGIPTDVVGASSQSLARAWSLAIYQHPAGVDGIIYPSRLNEQTNIAVYDRGIRKLRAATVTTLRHAPGLASILNDLKVAIAP